MWTPNTREQHSRKALRYQSDLTDAESTWRLKEDLSIARRIDMLELDVLAKARLVLFKLS